MPLQTNFQHNLINIYRPINQEHNKGVLSKGHFIVDKASWIHDVQYLATDTKEQISTTSLYYLAIAVAFRGIH